MKPGKIFLRVVIISFILMGISTAYTQTEGITYAERLGFPKGQE